MTALDDLAAPSALTVRLVDRVARGLARVTRRGFLVQTAVVGSALVVDPKGYVLTPGTAYTSVCGPSTTASSGYTVFCCTVNKGKNTCPPGTFSAGWWKAADSSWCCGGYRYIVDCNATCKSCTSGCSGDHICDSRCWSCRCGKGSSATCDRRRHCCNAFRYGQCNTHVRCSGGVSCRVVSCVAPYRWDNCTTTSLRDDKTAEHNAPCLQGCGPILRKYDAMGAQGSQLGSSLGPERAVGDGRGRYVTYENGVIYWASSTGAREVHGAFLTVWKTAGGARGVLGYPRADRRLTEDGKGWIQPFEHGTICDGPSTATIVVLTPAYSRWVANGRETGVLGYPTAAKVTAKDGKGWVQTFTNGMVCDGPSSPTLAVYGAGYGRWVAKGRETGVLGYPVTERVTSPDGLGWVQKFERGVVCASVRAGIAVVVGAAWTRWTALGQERGVLSYPWADQQAGSGGRGIGQRFFGGELWALTGQPARLVTGRVLTRWLADGGTGGTWGYPLSDVVKAPDGSEQATFEGGVLAVP